MPDRLSHRSRRRARLPRMQWLLRPSLRRSARASWSCRRSLGFFSVTCWFGGATFRMRGGPEWILNGFVEGSPNVLIAQDSRNVTSESELEDALSDLEARYGEPLDQ